jgi:hypothetical protein
MSLFDNLQTKARELVTYYSQQNLGDKLRNFEQGQNPQELDERYTQIQQKLEEAQELPKTHKLRMTATRVGLGAMAATAGAGLALSVSRDANPVAKLLVTALTSAGAVYFEDKFVRQGMEKSHAHKVTQWAEEANAIEHYNQGNSLPLMTYKERIAAEKEAYKEGYRAGGI